MTKQKKTESSLADKTKTVRKRGRPRKKEMVKEEQPQPEKIKTVKKEYFYAVGRRKESVARIRYYPKDQREIMVNNKKLEEYIPHSTLQKIVITPFEVAAINSGKITIRVTGGGKRGQAESIRLGIARALVKFDPSLRKILKRTGLLKRDARIKERKKYGLKRARRAPQWSKR